MGIILFLVLLGVGVLLAIVGGLISVVDAFQVSPVWGLLSLFVPFALLVYCIKFWNRKWARNGFLVGLGGGLLMVLSLPFLGNFIITNSRMAQFEDELLQEEPVEPSEVPAPVEEVPVGEAPTAEDEQAAADELFQEAVLPGLPNTFELALAELLPSTDPNERLQEVERERPDPYAAVPIPPPPPEPPPAPEDTPSTNGQTGQGPNGTASPGGPGGPGGIAGDGGGFPPIEPLPDLPEPTITASQVEVSGVVQINGETYAIVQAPGEPTSRYVRAGDRLSGGSVLVKRIETRPGSQPVVVLEERGVEIALPVGANTGPSEESTAAEPSQVAPDLAALPDFQ